MKKKVLIITLNDYIIYQPSILNLYDFMQPDFDVTILSFKPEAMTKQKDETRKIIYLETNYWLKQFFQKTDFILSKLSGLLKKIFPRMEYHYLYYNKYLPYLLKRALKKSGSGGDINIATDFPALHIAQQVYGAVHFLSLEIENNTNPLHRKIRRDLVKSVFIQTPVRYGYLFPGRQLPVFYVQNAPVFKEESITRYDRKDFIWAGALDKRLAVFDCIAFFDHYPAYRLVLKGGGSAKTIAQVNTQYAHLISEGRIRIDQDYLPASSFLDYLSKFRIGFCFYSWEIISASFNYATAPSGKLFMTLAAGVPVIACNIPAFAFLEELGAGVLVNDYEPETILQAMEKIEANYDHYRLACYAAARLYSFDKTVAPYIDYLKNEG